MKRIFTVFILFFALTIPLKSAIIDIAVTNNEFTPPSVNVAVGDQIRWTLVSGFHSTTSMSIPGGATSWNYTFTFVGDTYTYDVLVAGIYTYECIFHGGMEGDFTASSGPATYTWNQLGTASWTDPANWTPARNSSADDDNLIFNIAEAITITNVPNQTLASIHVTSNTDVTLQSATGGNTLTIDGGLGSDLNVEAGSSLNVNTSTVLNIFINSGSTAIITGDMNFSAGAHRINAADAASFNFHGTLTQGAGFSGNIFTNGGTANVAYFHNNSVFVFQAGSNPFGLGQPNSKVVFEPGSLYRHESNSAPAFSGRTYANFELNFAAANFSSTGGNPLTVDNITITDGSMNLNLTGSVFISGNINVDLGGSLTFNPASANNIVLNGTTMQTVGGSGNLTFGPNSVLTINNPSNISVLNEVNVNGSLVFSSGHILTSFLDMLILGTAASVSGAGNASHIQGPVQKNTNSISSFTFPVGRGSTLRTIGITTTSTDPSSFIADYLDFPYTDLTPLEVGLEVISQIDHFILNRVSGTANASVTIEWGDNSGVNSLSDLRVGRWNGAMWVSEGSESTTGNSSAGTVTSNTVTNFSPFALASTTDNPLPVDLVEFSSTVDRNNIMLRWTTAWELNNLRFDVQRKIFGTDSEWQTVGSVSGNGTTYEESSYSYIDKNLVTGKYEYRLIQIDYNGNSTSDFDLNSYVEIGIPSEFTLLQNYPNPFNPITKIDFQIPLGNLVTLKVYDLTGREIASLVNEWVPEGYHSVQFNALEFASGVYIYRLSSGNFVDSKRMMIIK